MSEAPGEVTHISNSFTRKLGPLPGWAWLLIVVGGAWGFHLYKTRYGVGASAPAPASINQTPGAGTYDGATTDTTGNSLTASNGTVTYNPTGAPPMTTNAQWTSHVADSMIATGSNPTDVTQALSNYVNGIPLTQTQQGIINTALRLYGQPPEGVIPVKSVPAPAPAPKPVAAPKPAPRPAPKPAPRPAPRPAPKPAPHTRTYTVRSGDSLSAIAGRYYGSVYDWPKIFNANRSKISNPNLIYPGMVLVIP